MSTEANPGGPAGNPFFGDENAFTKMWADFASRMMGVGTTFTPGAPPNDAARQVRAAMFKAWSETCDEFLRSPQFLETMRNSLNQSVQFRKQFNEFLGEMHHVFQGTSRQDIDQLMQVMSHVERRITDGEERLTRRLDEIVARLEALETRNGATRPRQSKAPPPRRKTPKRRRKEATS